MLSLTLLSALWLVPTALAAEALGTIDNSKVASSVRRLALNVPDGQYYMQNVGTGEFLAYDNDNGRQFYPTSDESKKTAVDFYGYVLDGQPVSRLSVGDEGGRPFCPSAQWHYRENSTAAPDILPGDFLAVLYGCSWGPGISAPSVRDDKQQFYMVPVDEDMEISIQVKVASGNGLKIASGLSGIVDSSNNDEPEEEEEDTSSTEEQESSATAKARPTPKQLEAEKPKPTTAKPKSKSTSTTSSSATSSPVAERLELDHVPHPGRFVKCNRKRALKRDLSLLERQVQPLAKYLRLRRSHQALSATLKKRAESRTVYIVTQDHLDDMQSRCLHGEVGTPLENDVKGTALKPCDKSTLQQWILTPA